MHQLRVLSGMPRLALKPTLFMDFFKILNTAGAILAWLIVVIVLWAIGPLLLKILSLLGGLHSLGS